MRCLGLSWLVLVVVLSGCQGIPEPELRESDSGVEVRILTWGEYPTRVRRARLTDVTTETTVWELNADQPPAIFGFVFVVGRNQLPQEFFEGSRRFVASMLVGRDYQMISGHRYELELWDWRPWRARRVRFSMPVRRQRENAGDETADTTA